jgi:hypothetical protein
MVPNEVVEKLIIDLENQLKELEARAKAEAEEQSQQ